MRYILRMETETNAVVYVPTRTCPTALDGIPHPAHAWQTGWVEDRATRAWCPGMEGSAA